MLSDWSHEGASLNIYKRIKVEFESEISKIFRSKEEFQSLGLTESQLSEETNSYWNAYVHLSNGKVYGCDLIVSATGVVPNADGINLSQAPRLSEIDNGERAIAVDRRLETSCPDVYAAGDVCRVHWDLDGHGHEEEQQAPFPLWLQMRLWTQARQLGMYAAQSMRESIRGGKKEPDFCFEMFTHVTKFFGYKVSKRAKET